MAGYWLDRVLHAGPGGGLFDIARVQDVRGCGEVFSDRLAGFDRLPTTSLVR